MGEPVLLTAWIDFLCPWSWVATVRLERVAQIYGVAVELEWRAFMRYPQKEQRDLADWRASTTEWLEPATAEPELTFSLWATGNPPPTHSAPALVAALVAADVDEERAPEYWRALFRAHFAENRTISDTGTLIALARHAGIDDDAFAMAFRGRYAEYVKQVIEDHNEGLKRGIQDTPAVVVADEFLVRGTPTVDQLRDLVDQVLEARGDTVPARDGAAPAADEVPSEQSLGPDVVRDGTAAGDPPAGAAPQDTVDGAVDERADLTTGSLPDPAST
jgi:predicted DsbA family dithiol-disulfide isomerase